MMCSAQELNNAFPSAIRIPGIILNFHFSFNNYSIFPLEKLVMCYLSPGKIISDDLFSFSDTGT